MKQFRRLSHQRGTSLLGLATIAVIVAFLALMGMRTFPAVSEFLTVRRAVNQIMKSGPTSATEIRAAFDKQKEVEYSITSISGADIEVVQAGERLRANFAYNKEIEIFDPVYLLLKFQGTAVSGSTGP